MLRAFLGVVMSESWVVVKFGGTSVSSLACWKNIVKVVEGHRASGARVLVVCSAPATISDTLDAILEQAKQGDYAKALAAIELCYRELADDLGLDANALLQDYFDGLAKLLEGISLVGEMGPRVQAKVMSYGEIMLTTLGAAYLAQQALEVAWQDARDLLTVLPDPQASMSSRYLSVRCDGSINLALMDQLQKQAAPVLVTQGFIAKNAEGETVLLGRGGSDTSAAYLAANLNARQCEIWTDVPGIYTANPRHIPEARLLKALDYDEAQEIASMGGSVLHPNCIPPLKEQSIPLYVKYTKQPERKGTLISAEGDVLCSQIKSILTKSHIRLISIETVYMWQQSGFLANIFACFKQHGVSIDLVSTSESNVTVSLDANTQARDRKTMSALLEDLNQFAKAKVIDGCASVSLVGHNIRAILHQLGDVFSVFKSQQIHLLSQAANDLNLTFVVDEDQAQRTAQKLHTLLIEQSIASHYFQESWQQEFGQYEASQDFWWEASRPDLLALMEQHSPRYVYNQAVLKKAADNLLACDAVDRIFYAVKANPSKDILNDFYQAGLNFECVSMNEVSYIMEQFPECPAERFLFTPNFAPRAEYEAAIKQGVTTTIDNLHPLEQWPELFANQSVIIRIDPGSGDGHHKYVVTGGNESKFGVPVSTLPHLREIARQYHIKIVGLHVHSGSGILNPRMWEQSLRFLTSLLEDFPDVSILNLGGGLGVVEKPGDKPLDLAAFNASLLPLKKQYPHVELWIEPGRYLVSEAGVLLARVTQVKQKGEVQFVGIDTGMNSLIRPALYGSYHEIVNLTRLDQPKKQVANIVGPICESGDTLGYGRLIAEAKEGDVILIANAGAYGRCMSSHYNLREPAEEYYLLS